MKRFTAFLLFLCLIAAFPVTAKNSNEVQVSLPTYTCIINESDVYYKDSLYPLLSYHDITYFPMTYGYCRAMNLESVWVDGEGLFIAYRPTYGEVSLPIYEHHPNKKTETARIVSYPVYIDGVEAPVDAAYPLLNFRDVTYFPMTWHYAHDLLDWNLSFELGSPNVFRVDTDPYGFFTAIDTVETFPTYAIISKSYDSARKEIKDGEEIVYYDQMRDFYQLDYESGNLSPLSGYQAPPEEPIAVTDISKRTDISGNSLTLDGIPLTEVSAFTSGDGSPQEASSFGALYDIPGSDLKYLRVGVFYHLEVPAPYTPEETYIFLQKDGKYIPIAQDVWVDKVGEADGTVYFSTRKRTGFRSMLFANSVTYRVLANGTAECLNDRFTNYKSIQFLGCHGQSAYLKCLWAPDLALADQDEKAMRVSPYNDGFYTLTGDTLTRIRRYTFTSGTFLAPNGDLFNFDGFRDRVEKIGK